MHICGHCKAECATEQEYLDHVCSTGLTPKDFEHQDILTGGQFSQASAAALARGAQEKG